MWFWGGLIGGLTHAFHRKRPWEGPWGAFMRATTVLGYFAAAFMAFGLIFALFHMYVIDPRGQAKMDEWYACVEKHYNGYAPGYHPLCQYPGEDGRGCTQMPVSYWEEKYPVSPCPSTQ
jgi:hypothetical protein